LESFPSAGPLLANPKLGIRLLSFDPYLHTKKLKMSEKKSICEGISSLAGLGAEFMQGVTGTEIPTVNPCSGSGEFCQLNQGDAEFTWDDNEEMMYREWIKEQQDKRENEAEWTEFEKEGSTEGGCRRKLLNAPGKKSTGKMRRREPVGRNTWP